MNIFLCENKKILKNEKENEIFSQSESKSNEIMNICQKKVKIH